MTPDDLARIEARAAAATEGPWEWHEDGWGGITVAMPVPGFHERNVFKTQADDWPPTEADAEFIAHARTDVPALVAYARELEAERDTLLDNLDDERVILGDALRERDAYRLAVLDKQRDYEATHREKRDLTSIVVRLRTERDDARAALARVAALCDEADADPADWLAARPLTVAAIRAAIAGPTPTEGDDRA